MATAPPKAFDAKITASRTRSHYVAENKSLSTLCFCGAVFLVALFTALTPSAVSAQSQTDLDRNVADNIQALSSKNFNRRIGAIDSLGNATGKEAECRAAQNAIPALLKLLTDPEADFRTAALFAIGNIRVDQPELVPPLVTALGDRDEHVRANAARALGVDGNCSAHAPKGAGMRPDLAVPALAAALRDSDSNTADNAMRSLRTYGGDARVSLPVFIELLGQKDPTQRNNAARVIAVIGPDAQPAVGALTSALRDEDPLVQIRAAAALAAIGANLAQAVPVLSHLLAHKDLDIRGQAAIELRHFGAAAAPAIPRLTAALNDREEHMRGWVIASLKEITQAIVEAHRTDAVKNLRDAAAATAHSSDADEAALSLDMSEAVESLQTTDLANGR